MVSWGYRFHIFGTASLVLSAFVLPFLCIEICTILKDNSVGCTKVRKFGVLRRPLSLASSFRQGSCHAYHINAHKRNVGSRTMSLTIRCEQSANENQGASVWLGRLAMVGFATAMTIEISTGKGLLENIGLATPQPTMAFFVTALVIGLVALFIFQSSSRD